MMNNYITFMEGEKPCFRYGSDMGIYTERFIDGRLICADFRDNGLPIYERDEVTDKSSFDLNIDGDSLYYGWELLDFKSQKADKGNSLGVLTLKHTLKPVILKVVTECCGYGFYRRYMEITNSSYQESLGLTSVTPICGVLWHLRDNLADNLKDETIPPYSAGYFRDTSWAYEGNFVWSDIPANTELSFGSTRGRSGHNNPFFVLRNNIYGGYLVCQLAWSANWKASVLNDRSLKFNDLSAPSRASLHFEVKPVSPSPARMIMPGETIKTPEIHFGISHKDFDLCIQDMHSYLRENVLRKVGDGLQPVIYNHWGFMEHELSEAALLAEVDIAAEIGAELFIVDAGWYADKSTFWSETTGSWYTGDRLPNDLFPVFTYAREKGLKCGLWMEVESAGCKSKLVLEHPDWFIQRYGKTVERVLDLTNPEVRVYVESEIIRIIGKYQLDLFRLDYNMDALEGGFSLREGKMENTLWRHVEAIYDIFDKVKQKFPGLQMENCSSGGGRSDLGIVSRFTTTWVSDWMRMPRTVRILNGMTMMLPPEYINRLYGVSMEGSYRGNADTQMHVAIMAHPAVSGITPSLSQTNPALMDCVKKYIGIFKKFIRPMLNTARVYHHTPVIPGADGTGWCVLEYASKDGLKAVAAVFHLVNAQGNSYRLVFQGVNEESVYMARIEPGEKTFTVNGFTLCHEGLEIRLDVALTSKLILLEAIQEGIS